MCFHLYELISYCLRRHGCCAAVGWIGLCGDEAAGKKHTYKIRSEQGDRFAIRTNSLIEKQDTNYETLNI